MTTRAVRSSTGRVLRLLLLVGVIGLGVRVVAQESLSSEAVLALIEDEQARQRAAEELERLELHPLDLNTATADELARVPLLDPFFIRNFLLYRSQSGRLESVYDLKEVQGAELRLLSLLYPYLTVGETDDRPPRPRREHAVASLYREGAASLLIRSVGDNGKHLDWALVGETDRGEPFRPVREGWMDHLSGTLRYRDSRTSILLGDLRLTTGRGLLMGQGRSFFSSSIYGTGIPDRVTLDLRPHRSAREYDYLRGLALERRLGSVEVVLFGGYEPIDARIEGQRIETLYRTGLHRDPFSLRHRHTARREMVGGYLSYDSESGHIGMTGVTYRHRTNDGRPLLPPLRYPDAMVLRETSVDGYWMGERVIASGEVTLAPGERRAAEGSLSYLDEMVGALTVSGRYFGKGRYSPYGSGDGHYSSGRDEWGYRLQWSGEVARYVSGTVVADRFRRTDGDSPAGTMLLARLGKSSYHGSTLLTLRWLSVPERPRRLSLRYSSDRQHGAKWSGREEVQLLHTEGEGVGGSVRGRIRYDDQKSLLAEGDLRLYRLAKGQMILSSLPWLPYLYGGSMLRGQGVQLSGRVRWRVGAYVALHGRVALTIGDSRTTDAALALTYRL